MSNSIDSYYHFTSLQDFENCAQAAFGGNEQLHSQGNYYNSNNHINNSFSNRAMLQLRLFCIEDNFDTLVDFLSSSIVDTINNTVFSTIVLVKTLRFIISNKVNLSLEARDRYVDFEEGGNIRESFFSVADERTERFTNFGSDPVLRTDTAVLQWLDQSLLFGRLLPSLARYFNVPRSDGGDQVQGDTRRLLPNEKQTRIVRNNLCQIASLCGFTIFCIYKDLTINEGTQFRLDEQEQLNNKSNSHNNNENNSNNNNNNNNNDENRYVRSRCLFLQDLLDRLQLISNSRLHENMVTMTPSSGSNDRSPPPLLASPLSSHEASTFLRLLFREIVGEFSDQPTTSPWDTFTSRSNFLESLFVRQHPPNTLIADFVTFLRAKRSGSADAVRLASADLVGSCNNLVEISNFILKTTSFLPGAMLDDSLKVSIEWRPHVGAIVWNLRALIKFIFAPSPSSFSTQGGGGRGARGSHFENNVPPQEVCQALFTVLTILSTTSPVSFLNNSAAASSAAVSTTENTRSSRGGPSFDTSFGATNSNNEDESEIERVFFSDPDSDLVDAGSFAGESGCQTSCLDLLPHVPFDVSLYQTQRHHVILMIQCASFLLEFAMACNTSSFSRRSGLSLRIGIEAFETCGRILANITERFPEVVAAVMASSNYANFIPTPQGLEELAQFCAGAGKYSMMFSENALKSFLTFANGLIFQIHLLNNNCNKNNYNNISGRGSSGECRPLHQQQSAFSSSCQTGRDDTFQKSDAERQTLNAIKAKLEELVTNCVNSLFEFIFCEHSSSFDSSTDNSANFTSSSSLESESELMLSLVGSLLVRKTGDSFFLIRHLTNLFDNAAACFFTTSPELWIVDTSINGNNNNNNNNNHVNSHFITTNVYLLPLLIQTVAQSLQACQDSSLHHAIATYTNSESLQKELQEMYPDEQYISSRAGDRGHCHLHHHHHPFINLLFQVCKFSEQISAGSANSLENLLRNLSIEGNNSNNSNKNQNIGDHTDDDDDDDDEDERFAALIPSQYTLILRSLFYLFRTAAKSGVMLRGPFSTAAVQLSAFVLRSSASSSLSLSLRNKVLYEDAISLLFTFWGSGNESRQQTAFLQVSEDLYGFQLQDRLFLTSTAAFPSPEMTLATLNHPSNFPDSPLYGTSSFCALRQKTLSLFYQRANIYAFEGNRIDSRRIVNQMIYFTNFHSWSRSSFASLAEVELQQQQQQQQTSLQQLDENLLALRCWLKDIKAAFCVGREVLHRTVFLTLLQKGVLGLYEEEMSDDDEVVDDDSSRSKSSSFWRSTFSSSGPTKSNRNNLPSLRVLIQQIKMVKRILSAASSANLHPSMYWQTTFSQLLGLLSDLLELVRQITLVAPVTLGFCSPSCQPPFFFLFASQFLVASCTIIHDLQELEGVIFRSSPQRNEGGEGRSLSSSPHIVINLAHSFWNLLSGRWVNVGAMLHFDGEARTAFWDLVAFVADSVSLENMRQLASTRDAIAISNVAVLHFCLNFESVLRLLDTLLNPRAALEDAILVNSSRESSNENKKPLVQVIIAKDDDEAGDGTEQNFSPRRQRNHTNVGYTSSNDGDSETTTVLLSKHGAGVADFSAKERFFSLTRSYAASCAANFTDDLQSVFQDHELLASWFRIFLGCIAHQPERTFYIRSLHCLMGAAPTKALRKILKSCSFSAFSASSSSSSYSTSNCGTNSVCRNSNSSSTSIGNFSTTILRDALARQPWNSGNNNNNNSNRSKKYEMLTILDDLLLTFLPLLVSNQLSHLEDAATSAIAIIVRTYDCCCCYSSSQTRNVNNGNDRDDRDDDDDDDEEEQDDESEDHSLINRFSLVVMTLRNRCCCLKVHQERISFIMTTLQSSSSFGEAVKRLSQNIVQLHPSLTSIFVKNQDHQISLRQRLSKKTVIPINPF